MTPKPIAIPSFDGVLLRGQQWTGNENTVLLLHSPGQDRDLDELEPLVDAVIRTGASAVAFDLRGHGMSDGNASSVESVDQDVVTMLDWLRQSNPDQTGIVAIGPTCNSALRAARTSEVDTMVLISPPPTARNRDFSQLRGSGQSKLIVSGGADKDFRAAADALQRVSIGWAMTTMPGTTDQGGMLIAGEHCQRIQESVSRFLGEQWFLGRQTRVPKGQRKVTEKT